MAEQMAVPRPDVTDMFAVHDVFRDTLGAAPRLVGDVEPGDAGRVAQIANYYENVLFLLETHHDAEEQLIFPLLRERCPGNEALFESLLEEHEQAVKFLANATNALAAWPGGGAAEQSGAAEALEALRAQLVPHLEKEEAEALALCAENLTPEEWGKLPGHALASYQGDKLWLILGLIRQRMNDAQRAAMLEHMPPPILQMWTSVGEQAFNDLSAQVVVEVRSTVPG